MLWPAPQEYNDSVLHPNYHFFDPDLKISTPEIDPIRKIRAAVYSGGFVTAFRLTNEVTKKQWAVRCFNQEIPLLSERYKKISQFIQDTKLEYFVNTEYQEKGILVKDKVFPIVKMDWVEGGTLGDYISDNYLDSQKLINLSIKFKKLVQNLEDHNIAHGDLQNRNIIVYNENLSLIDYDSLYIPTLNDPKYNSNIPGQRNFQHPRRTQNDYDERLDRFSSIIIYYSLIAIAKNPKIWEEYDEQIIFEREDYIEPNNSYKFKLIQDTIPDFVNIIKKLISVCINPYEKIPSLKEFDELRYVPQIIPIESNIAELKPDIIQASDIQTLLQRLDLMVEVEGEIVYSRFHNQDSRGKPFQFLYFESKTRNISLNLVFFYESIQKFEKAKININSYVYKKIRVNGVVEKHLDKNSKERINITINKPLQIKILEEGKSKTKKFKNEKEISKLYQKLMDDVTLSRWSNVITTVENNPNLDLLFQNVIESPKGIGPLFILSLHHYHIMEIQKANTYLVNAIQQKKPYLEDNENRYNYYTKFLQDILDHNTYWLNEENKREIIATVIQNETSRLTLRKYYSFFVRDKFGKLLVLNRLMENIIKVI
jgi:hypothetical protein